MFQALLVPLLVGVLATPFLTVLMLAPGHTAPGLRAAWAARMVGAGAIGGLLLATAALAGNETRIPGFEVTPMSGLVLVLVLGMGATVLGFAARSLRGEPYQTTFFLVGVGLIGAGSVLALTTNLLLLVAAWTATSALTVALIRCGPADGRAARSVRARRAFLLGDLGIVAAVGMLVGATRDLSIGAIADAPAPVLAVAGVLLVLAAATRAAAGPFYRWLPDSLGAPTAASALLHAGVVNAGAVVLIKMAPAVAGSLPPAVLAVGLGAATCVFAEAVMLTRPDVKGRLAWSTIAQMGFTIVLCGLGLLVAAGLHLVAHGCYKGALLLGSGSEVRGLVRRRSRPADRPHGLIPSRVLTGAGIVAVGMVILGTLRLTGVTVTADLAVPLGLAWVAASCAIAAWFRRAASSRQRGAALLTVAASTALFTAVTAGLDAILAPSLPSLEHPLSALWTLPVLAALAIVAFTHRPNGGPVTLLAPLWQRVSRAGRPTLPGNRGAYLPLPASKPQVQPTMEPAFGPASGA